MMDVLRTLLLIALVVMLWKMPVGKTRPIRDLLEWGQQHAILFVPIGLIVGFVWGFLGVDYGLQGLFFADNPIAQFLVGAMVLLLVLRMILQYLLIDESASRREWSPERTMGIVATVATVLGGDVEVHRWLRHGFLKRRPRREEAQGESQSRLVASASVAKTERDEVARDRFALRFASLILLAHTVALVVLLGVAPTLFPLFQGADLWSFVTRWPWLFGTLVGAIGGSALAIWSTCRLDEAQGGAGGNVQESQSRRRFIAALRAARRFRQARRLPAHTVQGATTLATAEAESRGGAWLGFLFLFFVIHTLDCWINPTLAALPQWEPEPGSEVGGLWPLSIVAIEATLALGLLAVWRFWGKAKVLQGWHALGKGWTRSSRAVETAGLSPLPARRAPGWLLLAMLVLVMGFLVGLTIVREESLLRGLAALGFVTAFLGAISSIYSLGTKTVSGERSGQGQGPGPAALALATLLYLVALICLAGGYDRIARGWGVVGLPILVELMARAIRPSAGAGRPGLLAGGMALGLLAAALVGEMTLPAELNQGLTIALLAASTIVLGGLMVWRSVGTRYFLAAYPVSALMGFGAFALAFDGLPAWVKMYLPSAIAIVGLLGLVASLYALITILGGRRAGLISVGLLGLAVLIDGNAWLRTPNQFKLSFPGLERYYEQPTVLLNSEAYFRASMPSMVKLRDAGTTKFVDEGLGRVRSVRMASADFAGDFQVGPDGLRLTIRETREGLRLRDGDPIRLVKTDEYLPIRWEKGVGRIPIEGPLKAAMYRSFHHAMIQFLEDGAPVGRPLSLRPEPPGADHGRIVVLSDDVLSGSDEPPFAGEWGFVEGQPLQLELRGLSSERIPSESTHLALSTRWSGVVARSSTPDAEVRLDLLKTSSPLKREEKNALRLDLTSCYLVLHRPTASADPPDSAALRREIPSLRPGDCLSLENVATESPIPLGTYVYAEGPVSPALERYRLPGSPALRARIEQDRLSWVGGEPQYQLRFAYDRGLFVAKPGTAAVALFNGDRLRIGDRLILRWSNERTEFAEAGGVFRVTSLQAAEGTESLLKGSHRAELEPEQGADPLPVALSDAERAGTWQRLGPLDNYDVLESWRRVVGEPWRRKALGTRPAQPNSREQVKPPLVIVTVSGGGIRSSVWTATVLTHLERALGPEFPRHIRLITGASGGMVGGTYYATTLETNREVALDRIVNDVSQDQLDAVVGQMVFGDIPGALNPWPSSIDRGRVLEEIWALRTGSAHGGSPFARPLRGQSAEELRGLQPSLVYTPMMVEDGRRLLISNLDLSFVTRNIGGMLLENGSRKINHMAYLEDKSDKEIRFKDDLFSMSAVEFYRVFPDAWEFPVSTAVRMSASFPWVSPVVSLPTSPPRRVVDAGYYDNYGVNLAALWLAELRDWLMTHTSGVVVIQIRDYVSQTARTNLDFDRDERQTTGPGGDLLGALTWKADQRILEPGLQAFSTPLVGFSAARQTTMSFRNDEQVELLDELFTKAGTDFFRTVVFECPVEASLSWTLSKRDRNAIERGMGIDPAAEGRVKDYFGVDYGEQQRWIDDHKRRPDFQERLKQRWDEQLRLLGFRDIGTLTESQSKTLYQEVLSNRKRLRMLKDWWESRLRPIPSPRPSEGSSP